MLEQLAAFLQEVVVVMMVVGFTSIYLQLSDISGRTGRAVPSAALFILKS